MEYAPFLEPEQRVIISGKVSKRSEEDVPTIIIDSVKPVDNSNIFTIELKEELNYEELFLMKNMLCDYKGSDPVMIKLSDDTGEVKVLSASMFWVDSKNELSNKLTKQFGDKISISIKSLDNAEPLGV